MCTVHSPSLLLTLHLLTVPTMSPNMPTLSAPPVWGPGSLTMLLMWPAPPHSTQASSCPATSTQNSWWCSTRPRLFTEQIRPSLKWQLQGQQWTVLTSADSGHTLLSWCSPRGRHRPLVTSTAPPPVSHPAPGPGGHMSVNIKRYDYTNLCEGPHRKGTAPSGGGGGRVGDPGHHHQGLTADGCCAACLKEFAKMLFYASSWNMISRSLWLSGN